MCLFTLPAILMKGHSIWNYSQWPLATMIHHWNRKLCCEQYEPNYPTLFKNFLDLALYYVYIKLMLFYYINRTASTNSIKNIFRTQSLFCRKNNCMHIHLMQIIFNVKSLIAFRTSQLFSNLSGSSKTFHLRG